MEWDVGRTSAVAASPAVRCARRQRVRSGRFVFGDRGSGSGGYSGARGGALSSRSLVRCQSVGGARVSVVVFADRSHNPIVFDAGVLELDGVDRGKKRARLDSHSASWGGVRASRDGNRVSCHCLSAARREYLHVSSRQEPSSRSGSYQPAACFALVMAYQSVSGHINGNVRSPFRAGRIG